MSDSNKVVHPFFQQPKNQKAHSPPPTPLPSQTREVSTKLRVKKPTTTVSKTTLINHTPATASCSTPYYAPIIKPKFYSDTQTTIKRQDDYNFYGRTHSKKIIQDHEFARFDRAIYGDSHIKQGLDYTFDQDHTIIPLSSSTRSFSKSYTFKPPHRPTYPRSKKQKYQINVTTQQDLQDFLDSSFPNWNHYQSCTSLFQLVSNKTNEKTTHQQRPWIDTYRPKTIQGLLGSRSTSAYIKDWLHQMKIAPMSAPDIKKKKKPKRIDDLDLLSITNDDDDDDFMPIKKTLKQLKEESMKSNVILLSGDYGVGKTTLVYTVAEQLGYEVFEINAGSRRSGKDIMSLVGDMTKNHHVTFTFKKETDPIPETKPKKRRLNPCLSSTKQDSTDGLLKHFLRKKPTEKVIKTSSEPKQSLILLEEVDLLFEEDKAFWTSVIELSQKSKRPIIMTCNDPDQVPIDSLYLQALLQIKPPTESELLPYLWLLCYSEGYTVDPADIICLVAFLGRDIRKLIQTLELYVKNEEPIFESYLNLDQNEPLYTMKLKCIPSRLAIDTFRLAREYENKGDTKMNQYHDDDLEELEQIGKALEDNALIDSWLGLKGNSNKIYETNKDEINGFTTLWLEENEDVYGIENMMKEIECNVSVIHAENMKSNEWSNILCDESSHWDEACDTKSNNFVDYTDAINKLLSAEMMYQPKESIIIMEYVSYIRQMISANSESKTAKTRSKRKRLYLPLNDDNINNLTWNRPLIDETKFWTNRLCKLKKESRNNA